MSYQKLCRSYILRALKNELPIKLYLRCVSCQKKMLAIPRFALAQNILTLRFLSALISYRKYDVVSI